MSSKFPSPKKFAVLPPMAPLGDKLILVPCMDISDWWIVERAEHDRREWEEYSDDGASAVTVSSARIVDGDIEGPGHEMRDIARTIEQRRSARFKRCQVVWTEAGYLMSRPRGGSAPVLVTHTVALALASDIRLKIGPDETGNDKRKGPHA